MNEDEAKHLVVELYDSHFGVLLRYASRQTGSAQLAEDIVQQSFLELYTSLRNGHFIANLRAWTFAVVRNAIRKEIREYGRMSTEPMDVIEALAGPAPEPDINGMPALSSALSVLSEREEEALLLRLSVMSYAEIGQQLGISPKTVSTLLTRSLKKLRKALAGTRPHEKRPSAHVEQPGSSLQ